MFALLLAISPLVPIGLIAVVAGGGYAAYRWLTGDREVSPFPRPSPTPPGPTPPGPTPPGPAPEPSPKAKNSARCSKTGEVYNQVRWTGPAAVQGGLIRLGYFVGPTLVTASDVALIKKFQRYARKLGLGPYKGAPSSWVHGRMGPCTLIALSDAESRLYAGIWEPES